MSTIKSLSTATVVKFSVLAGLELLALVWSSFLGSNVTCVVELRANSYSTNTYELTSHKPQFRHTLTATEIVADLR